ncbi:hypothetical protein COCNU_03G006420 [Cocos nucifera]|uniref:Uncharacterized protein n=1 Tax=Cocos nucifera TaxID=13894 RepID=A0A8K0I2J0_COCNU|nr:hypothetical protein COCNU_03G006420 [Cocos nucifera]
MARKSSGCTICEKSDLASICAVCVNCRTCIVANRNHSIHNGFGFLNNEQREPEPPMVMFLVNPDGERKDGSSGPFDQICNAHLPRGLDPHSVPSKELAASLE